MLKLLLKYKWYRMYCIRQYIEYVKKYQKNYFHKDAYLCHFRIRTYKLWIPCWTKVKEIQQNENSKYLIGSVNCIGNKFWSNADRIKFLEECLKYE